MHAKTNAKKYRLKGAEFPKTMKTLCFVFSMCSMVFKVLFFLGNALKHIKHESKIDEQSMNIRSQKGLKITLRNVAKHV